MIELFATWPALSRRLPHSVLAEIPTPVQRLAHLGAQIGMPALYVKRDDLSARTYGGNKVRKLEFLLGRAMACGAERVQTVGAAGSNHALATAIYARQLGLASTLLLYHQPNARYVARNLLMGRRHGARLELAGSDRAAARQRPRGVYNIPMGGSSTLGTIGFVNAGLELAAQVRRGELPEPARVYVALGTMGTAVGLLLGLRAAGLRSILVAVRVVPPHVASPQKFARLHRNTGRLLRRLEPSFPPAPLEGIEFRDEFFGDQYARFTAEGMRAVALAREHEGLTLEGTYTGKAFAALLDDARRSPEQRAGPTLFWNTVSSAAFPADLMQDDYRSLPPALHRYFEEPVQPLDTIAESERTGD
jgi:D-cysteine desulfhydrase